MSDPPDTITATTTPNAWGDTMNIITAARQHRRAHELLHTNYTDQRASNYVTAATAYYDTRRTPLKLASNAMHVAVVALGALLMLTHGTTVGAFTLATGSVLALGAINAYIYWNRTPTADKARIRTTLDAARHIPQRHAR